MSNKKIVVVIGMHRSGTSAVTRALQVLGVDLGSHLMAANPDVNAKGFWEDVDLTALNDAMLHAVGQNWHTLAPFESGHVTRLCAAGYLTKAIDLLSTKIENIRVFGFKDPRVARLLPFWRKVFAQCGLNETYVLAIRNPLSVARSLAKRDGFDAAKSYLLWTGHVLAGLQDTAGNKRVLVDYDMLMHSPVNEVKRIADRLEMSIDPQEMNIFAASFLDESLRHSTHIAQDLIQDTACPALSREIYTGLLDPATDRLDINDSVLAMHINQWTAEYKRLAPILNTIDVQSEQINQFTHQLASKEHLLSELENALTESNSRAAALENALTESNSRAAALENALTESNSRAAALTYKLQAILGSNSWAVTKPLRFIRRLITHAS